MFSLAFFFFPKTDLFFFFFLFPSLFPSFFFSWILWGASTIFVSVNASKRLREKAPWLIDDDDVQEGPEHTKVVFGEVTDDQLVESGHYRPRDTGHPDYCPLDIRTESALKKQSATFPVPNIRRVDRILSAEEEEWIGSGEFYVWTLQQRSGRLPSYAISQDRLTRKKKLHVRKVSARRLSV